jgi:hypothetical protein
LNTDYHETKKLGFILHQLFVLEQGGSRSLDGGIIVAKPANLQYDELKY